MSTDSKNGMTSENGMSKIRIVRNKNDERSIAAQMQEQCERLSNHFETRAVTFDENYLILIGYNKNALIGG